VTDSIARPKKTTINPLKLKIPPKTAGLGLFIRPVTAFP